MCALVWNRTSISCASNRRHHQIGFESIIVAGCVCPATGIVIYLIVKERARPSPGSLWVTGESNLRRSGKNRVLRLQSL